MFKKKNTFIKQECEFESSDGEIYDVACIRHGDRSYIQWSLRPKENNLDQPGQNTEPKQREIITIDGLMLDSLYKIYQEMMVPNYQEKVVKNDVTLPNNPISYPGLKKPNIIDHTADSIQTTVNSYMKNYDDSISPRHSLETDPAIMDSPIENTPEEWSTDQIDSTWKQEALERETKPKAVYDRKSSQGKDFRRADGRMNVGDMF